MPKNIKNLEISIPKISPNESDGPYSLTEFINNQFKLKLQLNDGDNDELTSSKDSYQKILSTNLDNVKLIEEVHEKYSKDGSIRFNKVKHAKTDELMIAIEFNRDFESNVNLKDNLKEIASTGLHSFACSFITRFYGVSLVENYKAFKIYMEYMDIGSVEYVLRKINRIPEFLLAKVAISVLKALDYLQVKHSCNFKEVEPENIFINSEGQIKLFMRSLTDIRLTRVPLNLPLPKTTYMSPERLEGNRYTVQSDIWSLGLSLVEMAIGRYPIPVATNEEVAHLFEIDPTGLSARIEGRAGAQSMAIFELLEYIVNQPPPTLPRTHFSEEFVDFVDLCLKREPTERSDFKTLLDHKFVQKYINDNSHTEWLKDLKKLAENK